jgi:hypothetical protein
MMAAKVDKAKAWLESQLSDGQEHRAERLVIRGMMAGYSERTLRRTAQGLHITYSYAQVDAAHPGVSVERWQLPTGQR